MKPLIDADVLRYEIGSICEGDEGPLHFDHVARTIDNKIQEICLAVQGTEPPTLYLTGEGNFREAIAVTKPYKGTRKDEKPFHFNNITSYMKAHYDTIVVDGMEADDAMSIRQMQEGDTVICTRDKDLRMVPGWHYGWECGKQREYRLREVRDPGWLTLDRTKKPPKLTGNGILFFYSQLLTGDAVDNIPGCPGVGAVAAFKALEACTEHPYDVVRNIYHKKGMTDEYLMEQAYLLWMVREVDEEGNLVMFDPERYR